MYSIFEIVELCLVNQQKNLKLKIFCTSGNENCQERQVQGTITN